MDKVISQEAENAAKKTAFDQWRNQAAIRLLISQLPPIENQDVFDVLLIGAFEHGFSMGKGAGMLDIAVQVMRGGK